MSPFRIRLTGQGPLGQMMAVCCMGLLWAVGSIPTLLAGPPTDVAETSESGPKSAQIKVETNQRFSDVAGQAGLCDVYSPAAAPPQEGHPVVVVVHGGGWISGDKWTVEGYSRLLARSGFVAITVNYRLAPAHKFPTQVDDVRQALIWTVGNAQRLSINLNRLGMFGYSAGGHLSALIGVLGDEPADVRQSASQWTADDPRWKDLPKVRAVCVGGPPCDFRSLPLDNRGLAFFLGGSRREKPNVYVAASPTAHASAGDAVTQIIHGESDFIVPIASSRSLHDAQKLFGVDSRFQIMPGQGHMVTFLNPKTSETMLRFFKEVLTQPADEAPSEIE